MKTVYFLLIFFICNLQAFAQVDVCTESKKGINNTYDILYSFNAITIGNAELPFDGKINEQNWQDWYKPNLSDIKMISQYMKPYIEPYLRDVSLTKNDWFEAYIKFDLQGNPIYITFRYPSKLDIPITAIEEMETAIKTKGKIKIAPLGGASQQSIYYIDSGAFVNLEQLQTRCYAPVEPAWNDDIAIHPDDVFPTATYYEGYLNSRRSHVSFCLDNIDGTTTADENIYISGIGEAAFTLIFINVTNRDIILDLDKITVRLDEGMDTYKPRISSISIDGGPQVNPYSQTAVVEHNGGWLTITFYFDDILGMFGNYYSTYLGDYKLSLYYGTHNMFKHIVDFRYDFDDSEPQNATWYRKGYIMFRYMYNRNKVGMFYNKTTNTYFY